MRPRVLLPFLLSLVAVTFIVSCKKEQNPEPLSGTVSQPSTTSEDTLARLTGEWNCNGQNTAAHVQFTSPTTWIALDTDLVVTNRTLRITMPHCDTVLVQTDGYNEYMAYADVGASYIRCDKRSDANTIYFVNNKYDGYYGYGNGSHLTYYVAQDSLVFYSDYRSYYNRFMMSVSGKRK